MSAPDGVPARAPQGATDAGDAPPVRQLTGDYLQVLRAMQWLYAREMRRAGFDARAWGQRRLRIAEELVDDLAARLGEAAAAGLAEPPPGTCYELTAVGRAELEVARAADRVIEARRIDPASHGGNGEGPPPPRAA